MGFIENYKREKGDLSPDLQKIFDSVAENAAQEAATLPQYAEGSRPIANVLARSALFACIQGKNRERLNEKPLVITGDASLSFDGEQLNQDDHDILMQLVFSAQGRKLGDYIPLSLYNLLDRLGRKQGGSQYKQIEGSFKRLVRGTLIFDCPEYQYEGHLVDDFSYNKQEKTFVFRLNPSFAWFYNSHRYTLIDWQRRASIKGDLARWLQAFYSTHAKPYPYKLDTLQQLCGSTTKEKWKFRQQVKKAMEAIQAVGEVAAWEIDKDDLLHVERGAGKTASQERHLLRK